MNENGFQFRTAAFGGFQKQDVMDYLERSAREHAQKLAGLQKELAEEKGDRGGAGPRRGLGPAIQGWGEAVREKKNTGQ